VFDSRGRFIDELDRPNAKPVVIDGLWKLTLGGGRTSNSDTLYFTAGPNDEKDGLLGGSPRCPARVMMNSGMRCAARFARIYRRELASRRGGRWADCGYQKSHRAGANAAMGYPRAGMGCGCLSYNETKAAMAADEFLARMSAEARKIFVSKPKFGAQHENEVFRLPWPRPSADILSCRNRDDVPRPQCRGMGPRDLSELLGRWLDRQDNSPIDPKDPHIANES
jgi:hypothetical protein